MDSLLGFEELGQTWHVGAWGDNTSCPAHGVTYDNRYNDLEHYNFCIVPNSGADAVLYGAIAILLGCLVSGKLSSVWILVAGAVMEMFAFHFNLRQLSNATALWMGMNPPDIFLYIFLPPLLLDSAIRIEFYTFRKVAAQVMTFAVLAVIGMALIMTPLMLYAFDLSANGWHWSHAALFVCMIASTDAVAVTAVLKKANGPETLGVLMEGESLFNDATSIVLFELMLDKVREHEAGTLDDSHILLQLYTMGRKMTVLAGGGAMCGIVAGVITTRLMKLLRVRGMPPEIEVSVTVGMCYLTYYVTNAPLHLSGVIAVVVFGLYGSATLKWDMSAVGSQEHFPRFWDVLSQLTNTVVFFFSGAACVNFFIRSMRALEHNDHGGALAVAFWRLPLIFISIMVIRALLIALFSPVLTIFGAKMDWRGVLLCTVGGLRGALCLIMVQTVVLDFGGEGQDNMSEALSAVKSSLALWTAGVVLCTLLINAPALGFVLRVTGLTKVSLLTLQSRDKARQQFLKFTQDCIQELQSDEDELLQGVDWVQVQGHIDCTAELKELVAPGGAEDLFRTNSELNFDMIAEEELLEDEEIMTPDLTLHSNVTSPTARGAASMSSGLPPQRTPHGSLPDLQALSNPRRKALATSYYADSSHPVPQRSSNPSQRSTSRTPFDTATHAAESPSATPAAPINTPATTTVVDDAAECDEELPEGSPSNFSYAEAKMMIRWSNEGGANAPKDSMAPGLSPGMIASLPENQRRKLVNKLDNKIKQSVGIEQIGEGFTLEKKASFAKDLSLLNTAPQGSGGLAGTRPGGQRAQTNLEENDATRPLLDEQLSDHGLSEAGDASCPHVRTEPYVMMLDPSSGFVAPTLPNMPSSILGSDSEPDLAAAPTFSGSIRPSPRSHSGPGAKDCGSNSPSSTKRARSEQNFITDMHLHQLAALPAGALQRLHEEMVAEHRMRLIAGLKRYFHRKRHEGLLSSQGLRLLDNACDTCTDEPLHELDVFGYMHNDFSAGPMVWFLSQTNFHLRKIAMCMRVIRSQRIRNFISFPIHLISRLFGYMLSNRLLLALEVAIEYWLALNFSMEAKELRDDNVVGSQEAIIHEALRREMEQQKRCVWQFIIDRHLEAPDRFRAIQTYRAAMAIMAQQRQFIHRMYNSGVLSDAEKALMEEAVEGKERELRERGAAWEPPSVSAMLRSLPLLADAPAQLFEEVLLQGHMVKYQKGAVITCASSMTSDSETFVGVILSGLAASKIEPYTTLVHGGSHADSPEPHDESTTAFLTRGSVFGVVSTLSGQAMPGRGAIVAHAETSATHVFQIPKKVFDRVAVRATNGDAGCRVLSLSLHRLAAIQILERFQELFIETAGEGLRAMGYRTTVGSAQEGSHEHQIGRAAADKWRAKAQKGVEDSQLDIRCMWAALRGLLQHSSVVAMAAGEVVQLSASAVLVRGAVEVSKPAAGVSSKGKKGESFVKAVALSPCVLVWPEYESGALEKVAKVPLRAGEQGAVLVMVEAAREHRARIQMKTSENVIKHLRRVTGSGKKMSVAQRASFRLNESYFGAGGPDSWALPQTM